MDSRARRSLLSCLALGSLVCLLGCSDGASGPSVQGLVTYKDQPLAGGTLMFYGGDGRPTPVKLSPEGTYQCNLPAGEYQVTVAVGVKLPAGWKEGDPVPRPEVTLPPVYASRARTPIKLRVAEDQSTPLDLKLN